MMTDRRMMLALSLSVGWVGFAVVLGFRLEPAVLATWSWPNALPPHTVRHLSISLLVLLGLPLLWRSR